MTNFLFCTSKPVSSHICMICMQYDWYVLVNPHAGSGKAMKQWAKISQGFERNKISYYAEVTNHVYEANVKLKRAIDDGFRHFAVVGGDGTLHHFLNMVIQLDQQIIRALKIGIIPVGTGNDFLKSMKLSTDFDKVIQRFKSRKCIKSDIGEVKYADGKMRYFLNVAGAGFDALVARGVNKAKAKGKGGPWVYVSNILQHLFRYKCKSVHLKTNNFEKHDSFLTILCGNGAFVGGGMELVPGASPNDGLLHITLVKRINPWKALFHIQKLFTGNILQLREASQVITDEVYLDSNEQVPMQLDGEEGGFLPVKIKIKAGAIQILSD